jgi:hypothetical protein
MRYPDDKAYAFEGQDMRCLARIMHRLYDEKVLSGDERRDLANAMSALMSKAVEIPNG